MSQENKQDFQVVVQQKLQLAVREMPLNRELVQDYFDILEFVNPSRFRETMFRKIQSEAFRLIACKPPLINTDRLMDLLDVLLLSELYAGDAHELARILAYLPEFLKPLKLGHLGKHIEEVLADLRGRKYPEIPHLEHP